MWGTIEVLAFAKVFKSAATILDAEEFDDPVLISGYIKSEDESRKLIAQTIRSIPDIRAQHSSNVTIQLPQNLEKDKIETVKSLVERYPGDCAVGFSLETENNCRVEITLKERIHASEDFVNDLEEIIPLENLTFLYSDKMTTKPPNQNNNFNMLLYLLY